MEELNRSRWSCCLRRDSDGIAGSNPADTIYMSVTSSVVCCQEEASASGRSLVKRSRTECGCEASIIKVPDHLWALSQWKKKMGEITGIILTLNMNARFQYAQYINIAKTVSQNKYLTLNITYQLMHFYIIIY